LGCVSGQLGRNPDWFFDIRTGRRAPEAAYSFTIAYRNPNIAGEVKYVWEPSRHHHLTILAAGFYITGRAEFAERVADHLSSWWSTNSFLQGIHWTSGIEIAIRLISWIWTRRMLNSWTHAAVLFEDNPIFYEQVYYHFIVLSNFAQPRLICEQPPSSPKRPDCSRERVHFLSSQRVRTGSVRTQGF
jgi:hypothetical protein